MSALDVIAKGELLVKSETQEGVVILGYEWCDEMYVIHLVQDEDDERVIHVGDWGRWPDLTASELIEHVRGYR